MKDKLFKWIMLLTIVCSTVVNVFHTNTIFADDKDGVVTTSITYIDANKQSSILGEKTGYYVNVSISGANAVYENPIMEIYLEKSLFKKPSEPSHADAVKQYDIIETDTHYIIKATFNTLSGGINIAIPFQLELTNGTLKDGQTYIIRHVFSKNDSRVVVDKTTTFTGKTTPYMFDENTYKESVKVWTNENHVPNDYTASDIILFHRLGKGVDARNLRIVMQVPNNVVVNTEKSGWVYNENTNTYSKEYKATDFIGYSHVSRTGSAEYSFKLTNQQFEQPVPVIFKLHYVNEDGSLSDELSRTEKIYTLKKLSLGDYTFGIGKDVYKPSRVYDAVSFDDVFTWFIDLGYMGETSGVPIGQRLSFKEIKDVPENPMIFTGYRIYRTKVDGVFTQEEVEKLSHNKLIGTLENGEKEVIATNIVPKVSDESKEYISIPEKIYKEVTLIFDEPVYGIKTTKSRQSIFYIEYQTKLTGASRQAIITHFNDEKDAGNYKSYKEIKNSAILDNKAKIQAAAKFRFAAAKINYVKSEFPRGTSHELKLFGETVSIDNTLDIENSGTNERTFINGKRIYLVPEGIEFLGIDKDYGKYTQSKFKLSNDYQVVYNYKGTGKTAYIYNIEVSKIPAAPVDGKKDFVELIDRIQLKPTRETKEGENIIDVYTSYDNNTELTKDLVIGKNKDELDVDDDGNVDELIAYSKKAFTYAAPKELIISKKSKANGQLDTAYAQGSEVERNAVVNYRIDVSNNTDVPVSNVTYIDVFPFVDDKEIVADDNGIHQNRHSEFSPILQGSLTVPNGFTVYYTTDKPATTLAENVQLNWTTSVSDYTKVTAVKIIMDATTKIEPRDTVYFYYNAKTPIAPNGVGDLKANNTVAYFYGNNYAGGVESLKNVVVLKGFSITGKVYYDKNDDITFNDGDDVVKQRTVELYRLENGVEKLFATTTTDANGEYAFSTIESAGDYIVKVAINNTDTVIAYKASTPNNSHNDINVSGKANVVLTPTRRSGVVNAALKMTVGKVIATYKSENGDVLAPNVEQTGAINTAYQTKPVSIANYELIEMPVNASGQYQNGSIYVAYVYRQIVETSSSDTTQPTESTTTQESVSVENVSVHQTSHVTTQTPKQQAKLKKDLPKTGSKKFIVLSMLGVLLLVVARLVYVKKSK